MPATLLPSVTRSWSARVPFYYGWVNVCVAAVAMSATFPGRTYGLSLIKELSRADLGITDVGFSYLNFWAIVIGSVLCIPIGWLIDRLGSRSTLLGVCVLLGCFVVLMSKALNQTQFFLALTLVRGLGQGALSVVAIALVAKWFRRRVSPAMGLFSILLAAGFIIPNYLVVEMVKSVGWRTAWEELGIAIACFGPLGWLIARSTPEGSGVKPDEPVMQTAIESATSWAALKTWTFWLFSFSAAMFNFAFSAITLDNEALLKSHGMDADTSKKLFLPVLFLSGLVANGIAGFAARRLNLRVVLATGMLLLAAALLAFPYVLSQTAAVGYAVLMGAGGGVITVVYFSVYGQVYGRGHIGAIQATVQVLTVLASATGPVVLSECTAVAKTDTFFIVCGLIAICFAAAAGLSAVSGRSRAYS